MANHKSAKKRIRQNSVRRLRNRYRLTTARTAIKKIRGMEDKKEAAAFLPYVSSILDNLVKRNIIHKNKAANLKSGMAKKINNL
ncbi:MAG: 30S ribosomal protein S20 [Flavobacteriales bacterium]